MNDRPEHADYSDHSGSSDHVARAGHAEHADLPDAPTGADVSSESGDPGVVLDEARLRRALALIGEEVRHRDNAVEVAATVDGPVDVDGSVDVDGAVDGAVEPRTRWWRRRTPWVVAAGTLAATAAIALMVFAPNRLPTGTEGSAGGRSASGARSLSYEQSIACSKLIVYGDILSVRPSSHTGQVIVTVAVEQWVKPARGPARVTFEAAPPGDTGMVPDPWAPRTNMLVHVPALKDQGVLLTHGRLARTGLENYQKAAPHVANLSCPDWYLHPDDDGGGPAG